MTNCALLVAERPPRALEHARDRLGVLPLGVGERAVEIEEDRAQHYFAQSPVRVPVMCCTIFILPPPRGLSISTVIVPV